MARGIWNGAISFGLINIPVAVMSAKQQDKLHFRMLDKRDHAPIGYKQVNKATGKEVTRKDIVKGYEYQKNQFVVITEADFERANPKATQTIDIEDFIDLEQVDPLLFEKPYYLVPGKNGEKGYVLLRRVLEETKKVAVARFVLRKKQHLVAILARGEYLVLEVLRYANEIKEVEEARFLDDIDLEKVKISDRELKMAENLVDGMTSDWEPEKYKDTYQDDLLKRIEQRIKTGKTETAPDIDDEVKPTDTNVVDLMPLLEQSLSARGRKRPKTKPATKSAAKTPKRAIAEERKPARAHKTTKKVAKAKAKPKRRRSS